MAGRGNSSREGGGRRAFVAPSFELHLDGTPFTPSPAPSPNASSAAVQPIAVDDESDSPLSQWIASSAGQAQLEADERPVAKPSARFALPLSEADRKECEEAMKVPSTERLNRHSHQLYDEWALQRVPRVPRLADETLATWPANLCRFLEEVRQKNGTRYTIGSLRTHWNWNALGRAWNNAHPAERVDINHDPRFQLARDTRTRVSGATIRSPNYKPPQHAQTVVKEEADRMLASNVCWPIYKPDSNVLDATLLMNRLLIVLCMNIGERVGFYHNLTWSVFEKGTLSVSVKGKTYRYYPIGAYEGEDGWVITSHQQAFDKNHTVKKAAGGPSAEFRTIWLIENPDDPMKCPIHLLQLAYRYRDPKGVYVLSRPRSVPGMFACKFSFLLIWSAVATVFYQVQRYGEEALNSILRAAARAAGIPKERLTPHSFRAFLITHLKDAGFSDEQIQRISGHKSLNSIKAYEREVPVQRVRAAVALRMDDPAPPLPGACNVPAATAPSAVGSAPVPVPAPTIPVPGRPDLVYVLQPHSAPTIAQILGGPAVQPAMVAVAAQLLASVFASGHLPGVFSGALHAALPTALSTAAPSVLSTAAPSAPSTAAPFALSNAALPAPSTAALYAPHSAAPSALSTAAPSAPPTAAPSAPSTAQPSTLPTAPPARRHIAPHSALPASKRQRSREQQPPAEPSASVERQRPQRVNRRPPKRD